MSGARTLLFAAPAALLASLIAAPAHAESRWAEGGWAGRIAPDRERAAAAARWSPDDEPTGQRHARRPWQPRRGRGLRIAGWIVFGVGTGFSTLWASGTLANGLDDGGLGYIPLIGPALAGGLGHEAWSQAAFDEAVAENPPDDGGCGSASGYDAGSGEAYDGGCGDSGLGYVFPAIAAEVSSGIWAIAGALITVVQVVGATLLVAGHLLGARRRQQQPAWSLAPSGLVF